MTLRRVTADSFHDFVKTYPAALRPVEQVQADQPIVCMIDAVGDVRARCRRPGEKDDLRDEWYEVDVPEIGDDDEWRHRHS